MLSVIRTYIRVGTLNREHLATFLEKDSAKSLRLSPCFASYLSIPDQLT